MGCSVSDTRFAAAPIGLLETDEAGVIAAANPVACELLERSDAEITGASLAEYVTHRQRTEFDEFLKNALEGRSIESLFSLRSATGDLVETVVAAGDPVRNPDGTTRLVWSLRTPTYQFDSVDAWPEQTEERALQAEINAATRARRNFLSIMSHELRTPLAAIMGYAELMQMGIPEKLPEPALQQVDRIDASARHLLQLIDEILTYSRLQASREQVQTDRTSVKRLLEDAVEFVRPLANARELSLTLKLPDEDRIIITDPTKLGQALGNLLMNAINFTVDGGVEVRAATSPDGLTIEIEDTGIGIAPDHLNRVMEPFWQVQQNNTREVGGTGLGLSVSREVIRLLGGEVELASKVDVGTTVTIRLPWETPEQIDAAPPEVSPQASSDGP